MLIGFIYAMLTIAIVGYELSRKKRMLFDQFSVLSIFFLANIVIPATILCLSLDTGLAQADRIADFSLFGYFHHQAQPTEKFVLLLGSALAYCSLSLGYNFAAQRLDFSRQVIRGIKFQVRLAWIFIGLVFSLLMFVFGNTLVPGDPIGGLLLATYYRADDPYYAFERTPLNANIYAATTTFLLFSVLGYALSDEKRRTSLIYLVLTVVFVLLDALASGSRRPLLIVGILVYMYIGVRKAKYKVHYLFLILLASVPLLFFGKAILRDLSDLEVANIGVSDVTLLEQVVTAAGEYGLSYLESLGTLERYEGGPRFGVDHLFSVLRMIPLGMMGFEKPWPERIVRTSTAYLTGDPTAQDAPPGYLGQCWIDFPFIGFLVIPLFHGVSFGLVERGFRSINLQKSPFYLMAYLVAGYLVAMPLNSGTLDFICSPDIVLTVLLFFVLHFINTKRFGLGGVSKSQSQSITNLDANQPVVPQSGS